MPHTQALYGEIQQAIHSRKLAISHYVLYTLRVSGSSWHADSDDEYRLLDTTMPKDNTNAWIKLH